MNKVSKMTPYLSDKLKVLSLNSIVLVIWLVRIYTRKYLTFLYDIYTGGR